MAITTKAYNKFAVSLANKEIDLDSDTLKGELLTSSYTPNYAAHQYKSDLTNEVTGTGYSAGGQALTSVTVTLIAANSWAVSRANSTAYTAGQLVRPATGNGFIYQAATSGTSGGSIPTYPTTIGGTVTDGGVTWVCVASAAVQLDAADLSWPSSTITARYLAVYDSTPATDATRPLVALTDFGQDIISAAGNFSVPWDPTGILNMLIP